MRCLGGERSWCVRGTFIAALRHKAGHPVFEAVEVFDAVEIRACRVAGVSVDVEQRF